MLLVAALAQRGPLVLNVQRQRVVTGGQQAPQRRASPPGTWLSQHVSSGRQMPASETRGHFGLSTSGGGVTPLTSKLAVNGSPCHKGRARPRRTDPTMPTMVDFENRSPAKGANQPMFR